MVFLLKQNIHKTKHYQPFFCQCPASAEEPEMIFRGDSGLCPELMRKKTKNVSGNGQHGAAGPAAGGFLPGGRVLAVSSWVLPGPVAENGRFITGRADEIGFLFMTSRANLVYSANDLPLDLAELPREAEVRLATKT